MTAHAHIAGRVTAYPRKTDCGVDGIYAQRSTETSRSSPVAAQRCAEGAGLDGGDLGRSTIICAVHHTRRNSTDDDLPMNVFATSRIYTSLTGTTHIPLPLPRSSQRIRSCLPLSFWRRPRLSARGGEQCVWANISYASAQPASAVGLVPLGCYADLTENGNAACLGNSWFVTETSRKARQIGCSTAIVTAGVYRSPRALVLPAISRGSFSDDRAGLRATSPYPERNPYPCYLDNGFPAWLPVTVSFGQPA